MSNILPMFLIGLVCLAAGFLAGVAFAGRGANPARAVPDKNLPANEQPAPAAVEKAQPASTPEAAAPPPPSASPLTPVRTSLPAEPVSKPIANPIDFFARALQSDVPKANTEPKSIAGQVDEILQEKLVESPLANRAIRLMELPGKGMVVMVGLNQYDGVDAVPDAEVRAVIRSAVAEWERRVDTGE
jgi:hypothetical protein